MSLIEPPQNRMTQIVQNNLLSVNRTAEKYRFPRGVKLYFALGMGNEKRDAMRCGVKNEGDERLGTAERRELIRE